MRERIRGFLICGVADLIEGAAGHRAGQFHFCRMLLWTIVLCLQVNPPVLRAQAGIPGDPVCRIPMLYDSVQATNGLPEYQVKAAIIHRCLELAKWPTESSASGSRRLRVGIFGKDQFGTSLKILKGNTVSGRKVAVSRVSSLAQARRCQLIFISSSETNRTAEILNGLAHLPVLTIGEVPAFTEQGGIINLLLVDRNIRLEVNAAAAREAGIVLHPGLIKLGARPEQSSPSQSPAAPAQAPGAAIQAGS